VLSTAGNKKYTVSAHYFNHLNYFKIKKETYTAPRLDTSSFSHRVRAECNISSKYFGTDFLLFSVFVPPVSPPLPLPLLLFQERTLRGSGEVQENLSEGTYLL